MLRIKGELGWIVINGVGPLVSIVHDDTCIAVRFIVEQLPMAGELLEAYNVPEQFTSLIIPLEELLLEEWSPILPFQVLVIHLLKGGDPLAIHHIVSELLG